MIVALSQCDNSRAKEQLESLRSGSNLSISLLDVLDGTLTKRAGGLD
jgi:hypothetical protein